MILARGEILKGRLIGHDDRSQYRVGRRSIKHN